jgi:membrane protease YdiL (CAAX protease family)
MWINPQFKRHDIPTHSFLRLGTLGLFFIHLSACVGFWVCFRPGKQPIRRLINWVLMPAGIGIFLGCLRVNAYSSFGESVLTIESGAMGGLVHALSIFTALGPGFHSSVLGFILVVIFTAMLALGCSTLPVALDHSETHSPEESAAWSRVEAFICILLLLMNYRILMFFGSRNLGVFLLEACVWDVIIIFTASFIIGGGVWKAVRGGLRIPQVNAFLLAIVFPIAITALISTGELLLDWTRWSFSTSASVRPLVAAYFPLPPASTVLLLLPAFAEEIIFRGVLQGLFVRRFGIIRGILLLTFVFASWHVGRDFAGAYSITGVSVFLQLCARLAGSIGLCFVTGWFMVKTGSVVPGTIAHGLYNVFGLFSPRLDGPQISLSWIILAYCLFTYWPVRTASDAIVFANEATSQN